MTGRVPRDGDGSDTSSNAPDADPGNGGRSEETEEGDAGAFGKLALTAAPFVFLIVVWLVLRAVS